MRKLIILSAIVLCSFQCSPVKETAQNTGKINTDLEESNWTLRHQKDSLIHLSDSLRLNWQECQQDNKQLHFWIDSTKK